MAIFLLTVFCIACYTGQTFLNRMFSESYAGRAEIATPVFSCFYGILVGLITFILNGARFSPSGLTIILGALNGVILFLYNLGMVHAARCGPYTFQSIVMLFGAIVVCLLFSWLFWGDHISILQFVGIAVMLCAFVVLNSQGLSFVNVKRGYFPWVISLFFTNGFYGVLMDAQQRIVPEERNEMIIATYLSLAALSLLFLALKKADLRVAFGMKWKPAVFAILSSTCAAFAVYSLMIQLKYVPSYIAFTINNGSILVLSAVLSAVVLKEKLSCSTVAGIGLSIISIVLLSL